MIIKERQADDHDDSDLLAAAGARAERQMAFYLKRAFGDANDVLVLNDLRLLDDEGTDAAQIDHLVLHPGGIVLIESKSVTSEVRINDSREFSRLWNGRWQGLPSPIQQSKLQAAFLQKRLTTKQSELLDRVLFGMLPKGFGVVPFDIVVAISDTGIIHRTMDIPEVLKADQVTETIRNIITQRGIHFVSFVLKTPSEDVRWIRLNAIELHRIANFLLASHRPRSRRSVAETPVVTVPGTAPERPAAPVPHSSPSATQVALISAVTGHAPVPLAKPTCRSCAADTVTVLSGKYGYYLKCSACDQNTKIVVTCLRCGQAARIRKEKLIFYRTCACGHQEVYHVNTA